MFESPTYVFNQIGPDLFEQSGAENRVCPWALIQQKYVAGHDSVRVKFSSGVVRNYNWIRDFN